MHLGNRVFGAEWSYRHNQINVQVRDNRLRQHTHMWVTYKLRPHTPPRIVQGSPEQGGIGLERN